MATELGVCCCSALSESTVFQFRSSRRRSPRNVIESGELRNFGLGQWRERSFTATGMSESRGAIRRKVHTVAALDDFLHNQVLVSSTVAAVVGQSVKPFTSAAFGKGFNLKLIIKPGGMPSTHSAVVTAAATAMGLERGFSDSLFGFTVIVAALFMYDAQGVRRSVGKQAEVINTLIFTLMSSSRSRPSSSSTGPNPSPYAIGVELARDPVQAELKFMEEAESSVNTTKASQTTAIYDDLALNGKSSPTVDNGENQLDGVAAARTQEFYRAAEKLPSVKEGQVTLQELGDESGWRHIPLKESVGHTKLEVLVGAIWGIVTALALHSSFEL
ncbi:hypothetical protein R1sor_001224 [Riccia sorocarpa]|uniref:Acid phosphatase/vanadium-dependent haloperoxidase-related protein n=1 Tax=Riccia sorocarpa TaxID=122646 RepID=A0ABD3GXS2_9MARC